MILFCKNSQLDLFYIEITSIMNSGLFLLVETCLIETEMLRQLVKQDIAARY